MDILRRKDVYNHEASELLKDADEYGPPARWSGHGCEAAGLAPGSMVYAHHLVPLAAHFGTQDVTCAAVPEGPGAAAEIAEALEASGEAPAPDMSVNWVIATVPHGGWQCPRWRFPHVHSLIVMGTPEDIRETLRSYEEVHARRRQVGTGRAALRQA